MPLPARAPALLRPPDDLAHLGPPGLHRGELLERGARRSWRQPGDGRLARSRAARTGPGVRRSPSTARPQRRALAQQVLLPDHLVQRGGPHADGQRPLGRRHRGARARRGVVGPEELHPRRDFAAGGRSARCPSSGARAADHRAAAAAHRFDTVNPPGNEQEAQALPEGAARRRGLRVRAPLLGGGPAQPRGAPVGAAPTAPALPTSPTSTPCWPTPRSGRSTRGRARCATARLGPGRARHEEPARRGSGRRVALAEEGWRPASGALMLVVTCDEEAGAEHGAKWLCEQAPDVSAATWSVNEGGGALRLRRAAPSTRVRGREGRVPLPAGHRRAAPGTPHCPASATTR